MGAPPQNAIFEWIVRSLTRRALARNCAAERVDPRVKPEGRLSPASGSGNARSRVRRCNFQTARPSFRDAPSSRPGMTVRRDFAPSRRDAPELCMNVRPTEGVGNAGCPLHPQPRVQCGGRAHECRHHRSTGTPGIPARNGFNGLFRALPGDEFVLSPSSAD